MNTMASTNCLQVLFKAGFLNPIHAFELEEESIKIFAQLLHLLEPIAIIKYQQACKTHQDLLKTKDGTK